MNLDGFLEMVHPDDRDYVAKKWTAGINGEEYDIEHRLLIKGKVKWVREKADITFDENGKAIRAVGITQDITEKKNAEETLKESEERWRSLTQYSASHIIILDLDYKIQFINHTVPDLTIDQIIGRLNMDFVPPDFHQVAVDCFDRVVKNKNPDQYETLYVTTEGEMQYFEARISPMFDKDGNVNGLISTANNITERKRVEVALKKSEEKFRKLFESSKDALMTLAPPTWKFASGNPSIIEMFGVADEKEFTSLGPWDLSPKYQPDGQLSSVKAKKMIAKAMKTGYNFFEWTHCKFKGEDFYATVLLTWVDLGGEKFLQATVRDISEQKQAKEELIESELLLSESQDLAKIGSWKLNTKTFEVNWSNEMYSIFGFKRSGQDNLLEFGAKQIHPDDRNRAWKDSKEAVEARKPYEIEYRIIQPNGNIRSVINKGQPKFNARGEVEFYIGFIQDITEQKRAEKAIMESNSLLSSIIESPNNVIMFAIDRSYNYIGFNNAHKKEMKLVFDADIEIGQPIFSYVDNENDRLKSKKNFEHVLEGERFTVIEQYGILENRSWYELIFNPIIDESKNVTGFTVYVANITDRKLAEEELIKAKEKAEEADHLKSAFLANMSHEIRTPMNGILGFLGLLKEPNLTDDKKDNYIRIVNKGGERLLNTINDIIEISKIESDNIEIENKRIEIKNLLTYYYDFFLPQTKSKQLSFNLVGANKMENVILYTDKNKLDSILTNLLKNAIKFTTGGKIEFGCKVSKNELKFFVKDTGIGIKKERLKAVFERFIQADINITKGYEGSGLGLAISSSYVEMLGGKIWVESEENKGSTFYFTLPMDNGRKNGEQADSLEKKLKGDIGTRGTPKRLKILITEDDEVSSVFLETLLQGINCEVLKSSTGAEAVYLCKHNPDIDIILMDIKLPDMNGYDATRKIREFNNKVKIIAQTAFAFSEDEAIAIKAGCNEYIKKPIKKDVLFRVIEKYRENE